MNNIITEAHRGPADNQAGLPHPLRSPHLWFSLAILLVFALVALFAPRLAPHDPLDMDAVQSNLKPIWLRSDPSIPGYWLGSDRLGRDIFSRLVYGTRASIFLSLTAVPLAVMLGMSIGLVSGYLGGLIEYITMRIVDIFSAFPAILFSVLIVLILRDRPIGQFMSGLWTLAIAFAAIGWVSLARLLRASVLRLKHEPFVEAARALGASHAHILLNHILPNTLDLVAVWAINAVPVVILLEAGLGYLGVEIVNIYGGSEFRVTSWGGLFFEGRSKIFSNPFILLAPTLCVLLISLSFSSFGDYLNKYLNRQQNPLS